MLRQKFYDHPNILVSGEIRSCVTQKLNDEMKLIVATDQWETEAFDWPGLSEDSEHSLFRFAADIRSEVTFFFYLSTF